MVGDDDSLPWMVTVPDNNMLILTECLRPLPNGRVSQKPLKRLIASFVRGNEEILNENSLYSIDKRISVVSSAW